MKINELDKGKIYKQTTDSIQGFELWEFTGETFETPFGLWYCFWNDRGYYYFDDKDLKDFEETKRLSA